MCGIAGWVDWQQDLSSQRPVVEQMAQTLCHRGPDAKGSWVSPRAALAHYRLFVIDPEGGTQPMLYQDHHRTYALTYNGELYNFRELRSELQSRGHHFGTHSDTEVLLHAYIEWGEECVRRFNGIFAFGLWDEQQQQLLLARDHLGVKPLFYAQRGSAILFGSELKALLAHPLIRPEMDERGIAEVFGFQRAPGSGVFRGICELRPAHLAVFTAERSRASRYWGLHSAAHTDDLETTCATIRSLLEDTLKRQLIADVPVVSMLSGGLDSSVLTALVSREFEHEVRQLHTYSIDFVGSERHFESNALRPSLDAPWVQRVSEHVHSQHHSVVVDTPELIEQMLVSVRAHDLPVGGQGYTSLYVLCQDMRRDAVVAISGESADEVFGGYPWCYTDEAISAPTFPWLAFGRPAFNSASDSQRALAWLAPEVVHRSNPITYLQQLYQEGLDEVPRLPGEDGRAARMREIYYLNLTHFLPRLLDRKDRMSMATGFEVRVPFCDYRLVEYVWNIPDAMKRTSEIEKGLLRRAMHGLLPPDVLTRRKSAYPASQNPTYMQAARVWALEIVNDANAPIQPFINARLLRLIAEGRVPLPNQRATALYERIIQMNAWLQEYHVIVV